MFVMAHANFLLEISMSCKLMWPTIIELSSVVALEQLHDDSQ